MKPAEELGGSWGDEMEPEGYGQEQDYLDMPED